MADAPRTAHLKVLRNPSEREDFEVTYSPAFSVICSEGRAPFSGTIFIRYNPDAVLLEFESFERWIQSIALESFTIETLALTVYDILVAALQPRFLSVEVEAKTIRHGPASARLCGSPERGNEPS